ncbi:hypothetical protein WOLCODRAFT_132504 [Wolfiporia cocos MD-104 SS10]|uniref:Uncharacterized protein n=1 Tax=Wolfiporia cocos (strain MD-104) TaxID=742152 RepID=A0A2H3JKN4_WOLCO|nr:hypothetical protein WOLCODRAFT_132504 [Wolfiporia cocos MD-104 SS10]
MDSLNNLASSLPSSSLANAEKDLTNNFKAAALSLTTLYRSSRRTSKRAYNAGYAAACHDLLLMVQQGVSTGDAEAGPGGPIARIMDYIEARLEAIRSREEEEDEDEEKERERERARPGAGHPQASASASAAFAKPAPSAPPRTHEVSTAAPLTPYASSRDTPSVTAPSSAPSPLSSNLNLPTPRASSQPHPALHPRPSRQRFAPSNAPTKDIPAPAIAPLYPATTTALLAPSDPNTGAPLSMNLDPVPLPSIPDTPALGLKRRHNVMMLDSLSPPASDVPSVNATTSAGGGPGRRRTRSARAAGLAPGSAPQHDQNQNFNQNSAYGIDAMDVEDEGRERKRVARR